MDDRAGDAIKHLIELSAPGGWRETYWLLDAGPLGDLGLHLRRALDDGDTCGVIPLSTRLKLRWTYQGTVENGAPS